MLGKYIIGTVSATSVADLAAFRTLFMIPSGYRAPFACSGVLMNTNGSAIGPVHLIAGTVNAQEANVAESLSAGQRIAFTLFWRYA